MLDETRAKIIEHANAEFPKECCGLIINDRGNERYFPCRNIAQNQLDFIMEPEDYARAEDEGSILAVVHSHPKIGPNPSQADRVACEASGLPWHIVAVPIGNWATIYPTGYKAPLLGREFSHGILDCYSLVQDWYRQEMNIALPNFERSEEWWEKGENLYMDNFEKAGCTPLRDGETLQRGDIILMQIGSRVVNHSAIYLGNDQIIHHLMKRLSCRDIYGGFWRKNTRLLVRYRGIK